MRMKRIRTSLSSWEYRNLHWWFNFHCIIIQNQLLSYSIKGGDIEYVDNDVPLAEHQFKNEAIMTEISWKPSNIECCIVWNFLAQCTNEKSFYWTLINRVSMALLYLGKGIFQVLLSNQKKHMERNLIAYAACNIKMN